MFENKHPNLNQFYFHCSILLSDFKDINALKYHETYKKIPVVLVLGCAGSQDHNVRKIETFYSQMGYHTIRFSPSTQLTFFHSGHHKCYADRLLKMIEDFNLKSNLFITHIFSNASCFILYQYMLKEPEWQFFRSNHKSAIFDSGPGKLVKSHKLISGISTAIHPKFPLSAAPFRYAFSTALVGVACTYRVTHAIPLGLNYYASAFAILEDDRRLVPHLFMYSADDKLIDEESVAKFIELKRQQGIYVDVKIFENCSHCEIYLKHPYEYMNHVRKHLEVSKVDPTNTFDKDEQYSKMHNNISNIMIHGVEFKHQDSLTLY